MEIDVDGHVQPRIAKGRSGFGAHQPYVRPSMSPKTTPTRPVVIRTKPGKSKPREVCSSRDSPM